MKAEGGMGTEETLAIHGTSGLRLESASGR